MTHKTQSTWIQRFGCTETERVKIFCYDVMLHK